MAAPTLNAGGYSMEVYWNSSQTISSTSAGGVVSRPTVTISASPDYAAADVVGGIITLSSVMSSTGRQAKLTSITLKDAGGQAPAISILLFRATPSGGTYTDNETLVWGSGDLANLVAVVTVLAADWYTRVSKSVVSVGGIDVIVGSATTDLYMLVIADAAWNAAATTDLTVSLAFEQM